MKTVTFQGKQFLSAISCTLFLPCIIFFQGCKKEVVIPQQENEVIAGKKKPNPPITPTPTPFFSDCYYPSTYSATFKKGVPASATITKTYVNSPGGSYPAFTSLTENGITVTAPAGTLNVGTGTIVFTATGTAINTGFYSVRIGVGGIFCQMYFTVTNAPVSGPTVDPGPAFGSTGIVNFTYRGQAVAYQTVRAKDGKIWLQQNLGSPQVAFHHNDEASYGDYFQWGRWDDGHQLPNSPAVIGGPSLLNPSNIANGYPNFIAGQTAATRWWNSGALSTDTWSGSSATSTNGKDPCAALGAGWRSPTAADWQFVKNYEDLDGAMAAYMSNLKLPAGGYRDAYGGYVFGGGESYYWSATANDGYATGLFISDNTYAATLHQTARGQGYNCRCLKD